MSRLRSASVYLILLLLTGLAMWLLFGTTNRMEGVALLISVLSLATAAIALNQSLDSKLPEIIVEVTDEKRYSLLTLVIKNIGKSAAYNIKIEFGENPLRAYFHERDKEELTSLEYKAIAPQNELVFAIGTSNYFDKYNDEELIHDVTITFYTSNNKRWVNKHTSDTTLDISAYRKTLITSDEKLSAYKYVPDELKNISKHLKTISDEVTRPYREEQFKKRVEEKQKRKNQS